MWLSPQRRAHSLCKDARASPIEGARSQNVALALANCEEFNVCFIANSPQLAFWNDPGLSGCNSYVDSRC
eukprot:9472295-Pyramimonas_sp.AAC.1